MTVWWKALTPLGGVAAIAAAAALVALVLGGLGFRWDPLDLDRRRLDQARGRAAVAEAEALARRLEAEGTQAQLRRVEHVNHTRTAVAAVTAAAVEQARSAEDANILLEDGRADRLRAHDRELCRLVPDLDGCAGAAGASGAGDAAVRPGDPAG